MKEFAIGEEVMFTTFGTGLGLTGQSYRWGRILEQFRNMKGGICAYRVGVKVRDKGRRIMRGAIVGHERILRAMKLEEVKEE